MKKAMTVCLKLKIKSTNENRLVEMRER